MRNAPKLSLVGILQTLRLAASLPELSAARTSLPNRVNVASPFAADPNHLNQVVWPDLVGLENVLPMTRIEAMAVPAMKRARQIICTSIARMPLRAYNGEALAVSQPRWIDRTDGALSPYHRMLWTIDDCLFYGWSLWTLTRGADGQVLTADRIAWERWDFDAVGRVEVDGELVNELDVCLIPGIDEGVLYASARSIRHASKLIRSADVAAETPSAQLELHQTSDHELPRDKVLELVNDWAAARRGKNGGVAYTNSAIEVREHGAADAHLLVEGRNAAAVDVARAAGIPASLIDATGPNSTLTYETTEGRNAELVDYGLAGFMAAVSARLGMDDMSPRGMRMAFDLTSFVQSGALAVNPQDDDSGTDENGPTPVAGSTAGQQSNVR